MAQSTKPRVVKSPPIPDAVDHSKSWTIREPFVGSSSIGVDYKSGTMTVPLSPAPRDRAIRNREMLRVKYSPKAFPRLPDTVHPDVYRACENARLDYRGTKLGIDCDTRRISDEEIEKMSEKWEEYPLTFATAMMETYGSVADNNALIKRALNMQADGKFDAGKLNEAYSAAGYAARMVRRGKAPGPKQAVKAADYLSRMLTPPPDAPPEASGDGKTGPDGAEVAKQVKKGVTEMVRRGYDSSEKIEQAIMDAEYRHGDKPGMAKVPNADWGEMTVKRPPRPLIFPAKMKSKKWKPTDQGAALRYPHRWLADRTAFAYRGIKEGGCTMLIDVSGSMRLTQEDILAVMTAMPASLIATYSGHGDVGQLAIVGEKGRRAVESDFRKGGGGNVIDGPALRWLAQQKGPRYWISDGYVTGRRDAGRTAALVADCAIVCRAANIMRVDSMGDVIEMFGKYGEKAGRTYY